MKAVILAAGMGKRIRDQHVLPKGFLKLGEKTIIEESIEKIYRSGIEKILLVTGYADHYYNQLVTSHSSITTIKNSHYQNSGSLYSLFCAKEWIDDDFILLESDLIYDQHALTKLLDDKHDDAILVSGYTQSGDEVYVEASHQHLMNMSKNPDKLLQQHILGEFVGINKLSLTAYKKLLDLITPDTELLQKGEYEAQGLVALAKKMPIFCHLIPDLVWCEIDDVHHLQRARGIYEKLLKGKTYDS